MVEEIIKWITIHGVHVPLFDGESEEDAYNRFIAEENEKLKEKQIAKHKEQADRLNRGYSSRNSSKKSTKPKTIKKKLGDVAKWDKVDRVVK